ncbi:MAG: DUF4384 domain-containing protein, partial [Bryobacteraceae bacterium]|nr:DUF4384 domain-containing protein [Bryobacteraceae bacterium]
QRLIVARRDLRPRLQSLDAKAAQVFAIFDACYSGAAIKSIEGDLLTSREISLLTLTGSRSISEFGEPRLTGGSTPDDFDYPYRTVIYLSASARSEKAFEISSRALASGLFSTLDGLPHGLLTNHLLRALHGEADTDLNGQISYRELHHFVYGAIMRQQTPQLLSPKGIQIVRAPVFEATRIAPASPAPNAAAPDSRPVTLRLHPSAADLAPRFANLPGVQLVSTPADLIVLRDRDRYTLAYTGGTLIERYLPQDLARLTERIRREPDVRRLLAWRNPKPDFNLFLAAEPGNQAAYATGEQLSFALSPQSPAWLLLIDIDTSGHVTVLHPSAAPQLCPADSLCRSASVRVGEPTGTELIKAFAFRSKPAGLESWTGKNFAPESPLFRQFIAFLDAHRPQSASAHLQLFTTPRRLANP